MSEGGRRHRKLLLQNHFPELTKLLNRAINRELHASLAYLAMSAHFRRDGVGLAGFADHFALLSREKRRRAVLVAEYLSQRGARVALGEVERPAESRWADGVQVAEEALEIERWINAKLISVHYRALVLHDPSVIAFLESKMLQPQMTSVRARVDLLTTLNRVGSHVGVELMDQRLRNVPLTAGEHDAGPPADGWKEEGAESGEGGEDGDDALPAADESGEGEDGNAADEADEEVKADDGDSDFADIKSDDEEDGEEDQKHEDKKRKDKKLKDKKHKDKKHKDKKHKDKKHKDKTKDDKKKKKKEDKKDKKKSPSPNKKAAKKKPPPAKKKAKPKPKKKEKKKPAPKKKK